MNAALEQPERVQALVLVDPAVYAGGGSPAWARPLLQLPQMERPGCCWRARSRAAGWIFSGRPGMTRRRSRLRLFEGYRKPLRAENWDVALWQLTKSARESTWPGGWTSLPCRCWW
jgi:pimeloyl-ACP methyl ester carboxylesterase